MASDDIQKIIFKLEIDDSGYIRGTESLSASTQKFVQNQEQANKVLRTNEAALKTQSEFLQQTKKDLDSYTGTNERYRQQLQKSFKDAQADNIKLTELVNNNRKAYELAQKAAQDFANISARATTLQQQTTGGKIPTTAPTGIATPIADVSGLPEIILESKNEFDQLRVAIGLAEERMNALNKEDEEFKNLAPIVKQGKDALLQYDNAAKLSGESTLSLRSQITKGREELVRLEEAGKGTSAEFITLEKNVAKLTNAFEDQRNRIKVLASETRLLDFGKAAIQSAISGFQVYTSVAVLAGGASEELQKKTLQLFAAMQLLTSLEQLAAQVKRGGTLATNLQSAAQATYTAVVGASTGALRVFKTALLATGIGAVVVTIGFLVKKFIDFANAAAEAGRKEKLLNEITNEAIKGYTAQVVKLDLIKSKLTDLNIPQAERLKLAKEYNKTAEEGNKIDLQQIDNISLVNAAIDSQIAKIKERGLARAAENIITQRAEALQLAQEKARLKNIQFSIDATKQIAEVSDTQFTNVGGKLVKIPAGEAANKAEQKAAQTRFLAERIEKDPDVIKAQKELDTALSIGAKLITPESLIDTKTETAKTAIANVFEEEKAKLLAKIRELRNSTQEGIKKINDEFAEKLLVEKDRIEKLVKDKKLFGTVGDEKSQAGILFKLAAQINKTELDKTLADFNKKIIDARKKLNDELNDLQQKNTQDQISLIQDEFDRRAALIDFNEKKELSNAEENNQKRLDALDFQRLLIGEQAYQDAKARIISAGELAALNIIRKAAQERKNLAADTFKQSLDSLSNLFKIQLLQLDETTAGKIEEEKKLFATGIINYDQFQKAITKILKDQKAARDRLRLIELNTEIAGIDKRLKTTTDETEKSELQKRQIDLRSQRAELKSQTTVDDPNKTRVEKVQQYAEAIGQVVDSVVAFWQKANEAESAALDRSISLQEKRVDAARRIAERGNAQYLKQEQDRLTQLNIQRENAARRQLAIDAALQASQVLVGITGAISHLASGPLGAAAVIADIAIIIGALATGYGLVKSLQGNVPKLKTGTTYLKRESHPSGTDTIPVMANEGEAWIPTETNRQYHPAVKAIYNKTIPAETLNEFVENYTTNKITKNIFNKDIKEVVNTSHVEKIVNNVVTKHLNDFITIHKIKEVPQVDYNRIKDAAELNINHDGKMSVLLTEHSNLLRENNELQRQILKKKILVEQHIDRNGVAAMVTDYITQKEIDRHS